MRITSTRVETRGAHDHVTVWVDGANTGTLIVGAGDGEALAKILNPDPEETDTTLGLIAGSVERCPLGSDEMKYVGCVGEIRYLLRRTLARRSKT
jgi:hypothetical protein